MLAILRIKNLALVEELMIEFAPGFNVLTGETGAGKSIVLGALKLALGERADRSMIRQGADQCIVEAVFDLPNTEDALNEQLAEHGLEPCEQGQLVLKRVLSRNGANRQFINGSATTAQVLATLGQDLVELHGPHDHQKLLRRSQQRLLLDAYGGLQSKVDGHAALVDQREGLLRERDELVGDERDFAQQVDLLQFQVQEIEDAGLEPEEDRLVDEELRRVGHAALLKELCQRVSMRLTEDETGLMDGIGEIGRWLDDMARVDSAAYPMVETLEQCVDPLRELLSSVSAYEESIDVDPDRMAYLEERLHQIQSLKRKYGSTVEEILAFGVGVREKLERLLGRESKLRELEQSLDRLAGVLEKSGRQLTKARKAVAPKLSRAITEQLRALGFQRSEFDVHLQDESRSHRDGTGKSEASSAAGATLYSRHGFDRVEFLFAPNPGEAPLPLRSIASSGEMARVMLAIKTVLAAQDSVPVLVFDEVDANVGGETANVVGHKLAAVATDHQVICVTHLAPVAAAAGAHYEVTKEIEGERSITRIRRLGDVERVDEIARMLGGRGDAGKRHAEAMLRVE